MGKILSVKQLFKGLKAQSKTMRRKLLFYMCLLVIAGICMFLVILMAVGVFKEGRRRIQQNLNLQLRNSEKDVRELMDFQVGNAIRLSERLKFALENDALSYPYNIGELEDNTDALKKMQLSIYPLIENALNITRVTGVFAVFDTTVNKNAPGAEDSRSGVYLRVANISSGNAPENDIFLFRGDPEVAMQNHIQLHNRWNMEFNTKQMEWYKPQIASKNSEENYLWIARHNVPGTWENGIFLSAPIRGNSGENYGLCGLEISNLLFSLRYPALESGYGEITTVLVPVIDDKLYLSDGLIGQQGIAYLNEVETFDVETGNDFNVYKDGINTYLGMHRIIEGAKDEKGREWAIAVFLSYNDYNEQIKRQRVKIIIAVLIFIPVMLIAAFVLSHHFVKPIVQGLEELKNDDKCQMRKVFGISEIDALAEFLELKNKEYQNGNKIDSVLPPEIEELFNNFIENSKKLTASEYNIMEYYIKGYEIADIPDLVCISMNTVRKHNRNIYEKLNVKSNDELRLYTDLLKRCGRIVELEREVEERTYSKN